MMTNSGNYYWPGKQPVGYDESGIPIDSEGRQCLSFELPVSSLLRL